MCLIILLFSVVNVTASDLNDTVMTGDDEIQILEQTNDTAIETAENNVLNTDDGTSSALQKKIDNAENGTAITSDNDEIQILEQTTENDVLSAGDGTFSALQEKINNAENGSTITLDKDYKYDEGFSKRGIVINKNLTIDGNGHTLDGAGKSRILLIKFGLIKNYHVTLTRIKFTNAKTDLYGGAIFNYADLTINNCEFTNNYAKYAGGAISSVGHLNCKKSKFTKNLAGGDGGAIFSLSFKLHADLVKQFEFTVSDGNIDITNNITFYASFKFTNDSISNCVFTSNKAKGRGGGAVYAFGNINIKSSTFTSNTAGEKGGAVFGNKNLYISNSKFTNNKASKYGGAVYFKCHGNTGHYDKNKNWVSEVEYYKNLIQGSTFTKNSAAKGGAIYGFKSSASDKHGAKAVKCTFGANKATNGRDIYGGTTSNCVFNYLKLTLNSANVKKSAKKLVLTAKLTKGKSLIKGKTLAFKFNGKTYKAKTNSKGIAKIAVTENVLKKLEVGKKIYYQVYYSKITVKKSAKVSN